MVEIGIPVEWLLGALVALLGGIFGLLFKNTRCIVKIEGEVKAIKQNVSDHFRQSERESERLRQAELDIAGLKDCR